MSTQGLEDFQSRIGYTFSDISLLRTAVTHSSYIKCAPEPCECNERLEFLGDAVLGLCIGEQLYKAYSNLSEGVLSRTRAVAVCETALYEAAKKIGLPEVLLLSYGENMSGGRDKPSILSDALEAVIGAIYLDGGLEAARSFILSFTDIDKVYQSSRKKDEKTRLQEYVQERHMGSICYEVTNVDGPDHRRIFTIAVKINDTVYGTGTGLSKHEAGRIAAGKALAKLADN